MDPARVGATILPISDARSTPHPKRRHQLTGSLQIAGLLRRGGRPVEGFRYLEPAPRTCAARFGSIPLLLGVGCGGMEPSRLAVARRERPCLVYTREPLMHLCGDAFLTTRAFPPHPIQRLGQLLAAEVLPLLLCNKFADGEVSLLLAGARLAESHTPDLYGCPTRAGTLRLASHLTQCRHRCAGKESPLTTKWQHVSPRSNVPKPPL